MNSTTRSWRTLDVTQPPVSPVRTALLALATVAIVARLTDSLHGGLGVALPERIYHLAGGLTLAAAIAAFLTAMLTAPRARRCERLRIRALLERGTPLTHHQRSLAITWSLMGLHCAIAMLG